MAKKTTKKKAPSKYVSIKMTREYASLLREWLGSCCSNGRCDENSIDTDTVKDLVRTDMMFKLYTALEPEVVDRRSQVTVNTRLYVGVVQ
jgi:hypothetical protein